MAADGGEPHQREAAVGQFPAYKGWRRIVRHFTPSWFTASMGTGIVSILLNQFPYPANWLYNLSLVVFVLNIALFVVFTVISTLRYIIWPEVWSAMIFHPAQSLFVGAVPMSLGTIINMICFVCVPRWGDWAAYLAWGLWITDVVLASASALVVPFILTSSKRETTLEGITPALLLPIVAPVVSAASGGIVASVLPHHGQAMATLLIAYVQWGIGVPVSLMVMVVYLYRLLIHKLPPKSMVASCFLPLGPLNMGAFGLMKLGKVASELSQSTEPMKRFDHLFEGVGLLVGLLMWSFSLFWLFFAAITVFQYSKFPFNLGWWAFVFPIGTFVLSTNGLHHGFQSSFFAVVAMIFTVVVIAAWILVSFKTLEKLWTQRGRLVQSPCVQELEEKKRIQMERLEPTT